MKPERIQVGTTVRVGEHYRIADRRGMVGRIADHYGGDGYMVVDVRLSNRLLVYLLLRAFVREGFRRSWSYSEMFANDFFVPPPSPKMRRSTKRCAILQELEQR